MDQPRPYCSATASLPCARQSGNLLPRRTAAALPATCHHHRHIALFPPTTCAPSWDTRKPRNRNVGPGFGGAGSGTVGASRTVSLEASKREKGRSGGSGGGGKGSTARRKAGGSTKERGAKLGTQAGGKKKCGKSASDGSPGRTSAVSAECATTQATRGGQRASAENGAARESASRTGQVEATCITAPLKEGAKGVGDVGASGSRRVSRGRGGGGAEGAKGKEKGFAQLSTSRKRAKARAAAATVAGEAASRGRVVQSSVERELRDLGGAVGGAAANERTNPKRGKDGGGQGVGGPAHPPPLRSDAGPYVRGKLKAAEHLTYCAAGVLPYDYLEDGQLVVLLGYQVTRRGDFWGVLGGKRCKTDRNMSTETAKRELYEETGGLVVSPEVLPAAVWEPNGRYVTYVVHLKGYQDLPLRFCLWLAQGYTCWGGQATEKLRWVTLGELMQFDKHGRRRKWHPLVSQMMRHGTLVAYLQRLQKNGCSPTTVTKDERGPNRISRAGDGSVEQSGEKGKMVGSGDGAAHNGSVASIGAPYPRTLREELSVLARQSYAERAELRVQVVSDGVKVPLLPLAFRVPSGPVAGVRSRKSSRRKRTVQSRRVGGAAV